MTNDFIRREAAVEAVRYYKVSGGTNFLYDEAYNDGIDTAISCIGNEVPPADVRPIPDSGIGEMSDGYHTFNGLYYQRMMLFAALVKAYKDKAWKSYKHEDGELCFGGGWFIVGIDTPEGSYTYHYESKDFDLFDCVELPVAKHWDGHTEADVGRLMSLDVRPVVHGRWIPMTYIKELTQNGWPNCRWEKAIETDSVDGLMCSECGEIFDFADARNFCTQCGADMRPEGRTKE